MSKEPEFVIVSYWRQLQRIEKRTSISIRQMAKEAGVPWSTVYRSKLRARARETDGEPTIAFETAEKLIGGAKTAWQKKKAASLKA